VREEVRKGERRTDVVGKYVSRAVLSAKMGKVVVS
jgi:hypothetical protein